MTFTRLACFSAFNFMLAVCAENSPSASSGTPNPWVWDASEKKLELTGMTNLAHFTFWVTNISAADATILATEAECDCTVVEAKKTLPWSLAPGASGPLNVRVNTRGRFGSLTKTVTVRTSHGTQVLTLNMTIPLTPAPSNVSVRQQDMLAAKADRQAVFRGHCAACHTPPATGLTVATLFEKACGICHTAQYRAEVVPDLAALKHPTDAAYWRAWIASGKEGSLMPAFAKSQGGILESNEIESLVAHLTEKFPSQAAANVSPGSANTPPPTLPENSAALSPQQINKTAP